MNAFHTIAIPHSDILKGKLTMDIFAADLWEVYKGTGPDEYKDAQQFFKKTYKTEGLKNLLAVVEKRLLGKGGDPVIQVQTPFGGGKTHSLIAIYHKAAEWKAKQVVIVGTTMKPDDTIWGMIEEQLTGKRKDFTAKTSPGRDAMQGLLKKHQPLVILMDEVLQYVVKAAGVKVGGSTLAAQTIAFMQEFTEAVKTLDKTALLITLPSSEHEHYDEEGEKLFQRLTKVVGRVEKIYVPVEDHEITSVIRQRLFAIIDTKKVQVLAQEYTEYLKKESLIPAGIEPSEYRKKFEAAYPFQPEVVEILHERWGSYSNFQRTRGVLRLLSLVVYSLRNASIPYITMADFDLGNQEIRRELLKFAGNEFNGVIAADITGDAAGAKSVDAEIGSSYQGLRLGSRAATAIFMCSFSGGTQKGIGLAEAKRMATTLQNPANAVGEAATLLKDKLFYLQYQNGKYFFTNEPNLNRTLIQKMENIDGQSLQQMEQDLLRQHISGRKLKVLLWPRSNADIDDTPSLKLIVLEEPDKIQMKDLMEKKGTTPRVNRNTLIFLVPLESEQSGFHTTLRRSQAYTQILSDKQLNLSADQKKVIKEELKKLEEGMNDCLRRYYRMIYLPSKNGLKEEDLGVPTYGENRKLDEVIYEKLRVANEIVPQIAPIVIKERYLKDKEYVKTEQLASSSLTTPGEARVLDRSVWEDGIREGVTQGLFGLGELSDGKAVCHYYKQRPTIALTGNEILIQDKLCKGEEELGEPTKGATTVVEPPLVRPTGGDHKWREHVDLDFEVPRGKVSQLMGVLNLLQSKFPTLNMKIVAEGGKISEQDYEDKVIEAFRQLGIDIE